MPMLKKQISFLFSLSLRVGTDLERQHQLPRLQNQNHQREARMRLEQLRQKSMPREDTFESSSH